VSRTAEQITDVSLNDSNMLRETKIILASSSPRRADLLRAIGVNFELEPSQIHERPHPDEAPADYIIRLARAKVIDVARKRDSGLLIGADTIVVLDGRILRKPEDPEEARQMLRQLSGRWHAVMTGVALYDAATKAEVADYDKTLVRFAELSDREVEWYVDSGEPMDKAGAYAIQGLAAIFIDEIAGNYHNVVGLPIPLVYRLAKRLGYSFVS
jgi:nucleoside triphosphate pyrophosphatase